MRGQLFSYAMQHSTKVLINVGKKIIFSPLSVRPTLSRAQSVAISSRNTPCVASVIQRYARRRRQYAGRFKQWKVDRWGHQQWRPSSCTMERHQVRRTKTRGLWKDPGKDPHGSASEASVLLEGCLLGKQSDWCSLHVYHWNTSILSVLVITKRKIRMLLYQHWHAH